MPIDEQDYALVVCIPVRAKPDHGATATYSTFDNVPCPDCGEGMWLGAHSKTLHEADPKLVKITCMLCALRHYGLKGTEKITPLTGEAQA